MSIIGIKISHHDKIRNWQIAENVKDQKLEREYGEI